MADRPLPLTEAIFAEAVAELVVRDAELARVVRKWGRPPFWVHDPGFRGLVLAILSQQVSVESAEAAFAKLERHLSLVTPEGFLTLGDDALRVIGFSRQKAGYVRGLAEGLVSGSVDLDGIGEMGDEAARQALIAIMGVGPWTADTYILFSLRRPDAWPFGDLALAKAVQELRGLDDLPSYVEVDVIGEAWRPWRAVAARILWHHYLSERGRN